MVRGMAGTLLFKRLLKGKVHAEAVEEEDGREAPPYGRDASVGRPGSSPGGVANPGGAGRTHTGTLTKSSMSLGADAVKHPGLKRALTKKLSTIAPSPTEIATASSNEVGEVVIEVVLATGLQKPSLGPRIGGPPPSPFVKLVVRGSEKRSRKEERTNYPMWNERFVWHGKRGELCTPKMHVEVLAWDPLTPTSMGRAEVDLAPLLVGTSCELMVALGEVRRMPSAVHPYPHMHHVRASRPPRQLHPAAPTPLHPAAPRHTHPSPRCLQGKGQLQLRGLWVARERGKMHLRLESASGLPSPDGQSGPANPYVVAKLNGKDHRTGVKKKTRSPQWGEHFEWAGFKSELTRGSLHLEVRNKDAVYMQKHGKAEVLGTADVELHAVLETSDGVHSLELPLSRNGGSTGQLHVKVHWERGCAHWDPDSLAKEEAHKRVAAKMQPPVCLASAKETIDKYGSAVDLHKKKVRSLSDQKDKVHKRQSEIEDTLEEQQELMEELSKQQDEIVRQVRLADGKPATLCA